MTGLFWLLLFIVAVALFGGAVFAVGWFALWYALVGLVVGAIARMFVRGTFGLGLVPTILAGVIGSIGGGWIAEFYDLGGLLQFAIAVLLAAIVIALANGSRSDR